MTTTPRQEGDFDEQAAIDDKLISKLINPGEEDADALDGQIGWGDTVGKVDDAVDYEDISDDDLPSEEEAPSKPAGKDEDEEMGMGMGMSGDMLEGLENAGPDGMDLDDLFGDMEDDDNMLGDSVPPPVNGEFEDLNGFDLPGANGNLPSDVSRASSEDEVLRGYGMEDVAMGGAPVIEDPVLLAKQYYPEFEPHTILSFSTIFNPKPGTLQTGPQKAPKVCLPSKVHIEIAPDEGTLFLKQTSSAHKGATASRSRGVVTIPPPVEEEPEEEEETEDQDDGKDPMFERDLEIACCDWESKLEAAMATPPQSPQTRGRDEFEEGVTELGPPVKVCSAMLNLCASC
jgi:hypothetical protein